jgi:hypothetical protein
MNDRKFVKQKELELKEKELALKEKELNQKEKEEATEDVAEDDTEDEADGDEEVAEEEAKPAPANGASDVDKLVGEWSDTDEPSIHMKFTRDGKFEFTDWNSKTEKELKGNFELRGGSLTLLYDDRPNKPSNSGRAETVRTAIPSKKATITSSNRQSGLINRLLRPAKLIKQKGRADARLF